MTTTKHPNRLFSVENVVNGALDYYLFSSIGIDPNTGEGIAGQRFADDIDFIQNVMKDDVKVINVRINSGGGSIVEGLSMLSAIRNCSIPVDTYIEGIAASMAGVIAMSGRKRFMNDYSRIMIHDPLIDAAELTDADKETLKNFKDILKTIFVNNSHYTPEEIDRIMTVETWMNAKDAERSGLIDSIVKTERNLGVFANDSKIVYSFANDILKLKIKNEKPITMKKVFAKFTELKLFKNNEQESETEKVETAVIETVESLLQKNKDLEAANAAKDQTIAEKDAKIAELTGNVKDVNDTAAETAVDAAINDGKIEIAKRDEMLVIAKKDLKSFNTMTGAIAKKAVKAMNVIRDNAGKEITGEDGKVNGKTLRELERTDEKLVQKIKNENPSLYEKLYFAQYGTKPAGI